MKWEYTSITSGHIDDLNALGREGWELVSIIPDVSDPRRVCAYFKRKAQNHIMDL